MSEETSMNYEMALKHYHVNGRGRSMRKFCVDEGYDYDKFLRYSRKGQKEYSVLKESDAERQSESGFIPLEVAGESERSISIKEVRVRFSNGLELVQGEGDVNELFGIIRKILS